jgi:uncharacterized membrane protein YhdT
VNMTHRQKVNHLIEELGKQGVDSDTAAPPLFRLFWKLGLNLAPPFFLRFGITALVMGTCFGVLEIPLWVILMCLSLSLGETVLVAVLTGGLRVGDGLVFAF